MAPSESTALDADTSSHTVQRGAGLPPAVDLSRTSHEPFLPEADVTGDVSVPEGGRERIGVSSTGRGVLGVPGSGPTVLMDRAPTPTPPARAPGAPPVPPRPTWAGWERSWTPGEQRTLIAGVVGRRPLSSIAHDLAITESDIVARTMRLFLAYDGEFPRRLPAPSRLPRFGWLEEWRIRSAADAGEGLAAIAGRLDRDPLEVGRYLIEKRVLRMPRSVRLMQW